MFNNSNVITPRTYKQLTHQAKMILESKRLLPKEKQNYSVAEIESIIQIGQSYNLSPWQSVQAIMIVNGQASVWGDFLIGLVWASGKTITIQETSEGRVEDGTFVAMCSAKRGDSVITRSFSIEDAKKAGLWNKGPIWRGYPARMLQMRARSWCLRDGFGDVLKGLVAVEEAVDYKPLDDKTEPSVVEKKIIETIASEEKPKKEESVKEQPEKEEALVEKYLSNAELLVKKVGIADISSEIKDPQVCINDFLVNKKAPMEELVARALDNFETFFPLLLEFARGGDNG